MVSLSTFDLMPCRYRSKYKWDFTTVRACGGNPSVRASCHVLGVQCFPVWLGWCLQLLMDSQRWAVCDAHPAEPPLTDPQGDNLTSVIDHSLSFSNGFPRLSSCGHCSCVFTFALQEYPTKRLRKVFSLFVSLFLWLSS